MFRATVKSLLAHKRRLVTTSLAVLLGVAFMSGTFVLTDTIGKTFDDVFATAYEDVDAHVRSAETTEDTFGQTQRPRVGADLVDTVAQVDGVRAAEGYVEGYTQLVDTDGEPVGNPASGAPTFGANWSDDPDLNPFTLTEGRGPQAADEVVVDAASAETAGYEVGDTATVLTPEGPIEVSVVGVARFGEIDSLAGASFTFFTTERAQELLAEPGRFDAIDVVATEGVSQEELRDRIAAELPAEAEVLTGTEITEENQSALAEGLSFFNSFLVVFALIALFVGAFIIYNTFSILVAQRTREMALLRAIGASRRQVLGSVLAEAVVVGLVATLGGLIGGIAVATGLQALFRAGGFGLPEGDLVVLPRTAVVALVTGVGVTVLSAVLPARRASKIAPLAALRDVAVDRSSRSALRVVIGVVITLLGGALLLSGLLGGGDNALVSVGLGAAITFVGIAVLGPVIARPVSRLIGAPLPRLRGMAGTLARENAMRNPRRTASTASALMIGVALVSSITILASSTKASIDELIDAEFAGDFIIESGTFGVMGGLSPDLADEVAEIPEVAAAPASRIGSMELDVFSGAVPVRGTDVAALVDVFGLEVVEGDAEDLGTTGIAVDTETAEVGNLEVGDTVQARFVDTGEHQLTVAMIYATSVLQSGFVLEVPAFETYLPGVLDAFVFVDLVDGADPAAVRSDLAAIVDEHPNATLQDLTEYKEAQTAQVDQLLNMIYVLLALAVVIALIGIANTLALSIFERTRELGLLRAVGMTRSQLRSTVRWESVIIALLGTSLGLVIGLFFGWALFMALQEEGFAVFSPAPGQLAVVAVLAALAGVAAAILPARKASRLDILDAIGAE